MVSIFVFGTVAGVVPPFLRRFGKARCVCLAPEQQSSSFLLVGLTHPDPSQGLAAVEANRREYLFVLACESPVLALGFFPYGGLTGCSSGSAGESTPLSPPAY
jgi:hypothetical protein